MPIPKNLREEFKDKEFAHAYADEFLNVYIATQIKVLREQHKLSQEELAELTGMKQERISVLENVDYSSWSINTLRKLAKAFDVTLRVTFETFGRGVSEMKNLNRLALERVSREQEIEWEEKAEKWTHALLAGKSSSANVVKENLLRNKGSTINTANTTVSSMASVTGELIHPQIPSDLETASTPIQIN